MDELAQSVERQLSSQGDPLFPVENVALARATQVDDLVASGNAKAARSSRMVTRLTRELSEAKAQCRALDIENVSLRDALERARDDIEAARSLRRELDEARARCRDMEQRVVEETRRAELLRQNAIEADAEKERLRTLLAGTVWYECESKAKAMVG